MGNTKLQYLLLSLGVALIAIGFVWGGWCIGLLWFGCNFSILGFAHGRGYHGVFGKRRDGTLPICSWLLFLPMLLYTNAVWYLVRWFSREPAHNRVTDSLVVGRRSLSWEVENEFNNYVDLTAEFSEPLPMRRTAAYLSFPILDGAAPTPEALGKAVAGLRPGATFVHCAQGHGRTGLFALAILLDSGIAHTVEDGLTMLTAVRPGIRLSAEQFRCAQLFAEMTNPKG